MYDDLPPGQVHVLDVESITDADMSPADLEDLRSILRQLAECRIGTWLLVQATQHQLVLRYAKDPSELMLPGRGAAGGLYHAGQHLITVGRDLGRAFSIACIAHELQHFVDDVTEWGLDSIDCEVRAYQTEARVILDLGLDMTCHGLGSNGDVRHPADLRSRLLNNRLYDRKPSHFTTPPGGREHPFLPNSALYPAISRIVTGGSGGTRVGGIAPVTAVTQAQHVRRAGPAQAPRWNPKPAWKTEHTRFSDQPGEHDEVEFLDELTDAARPLEPGSLD